MATADAFTISGPATPDSLDAVHALLHNFWHAVSTMDAADRMRFDLAVAEVAANIIEHCDPPAQMVLCLRQYEDRVEAVFDETGAELPADVIEAASQPDDLAESGRGLLLARSALDTFEYDRQGDMNHWRLVRMRHDSD